MPFRRIAAHTLVDSFVNGGNRINRHDEHNSAIFPANGNANPGDTVHPQHPKTIGVPKLDRSGRAFRSELVDALQTLKLPRKHVMIRGHFGHRARIWILLMEPQQIYGGVVGW